MDKGDVYILMFFLVKFCLSNINFYLKNCFFSVENIFFFVEGSLLFILNVCMNLYYFLI